MAEPHPVREVLNNYTNSLLYNDQKFFKCSLIKKFYILVVHMLKMLPKLFLAFKIIYSNYANLAQKRKKKKD